MMNKDKKLGPVLLSGLIIGPVLGSGIILLPPMIYKTTGDYAIWAWLVMMVIGLLYASLFGQLSIKYPSESGVSYIVDQAFGSYIKQLTSVFFIIAGSFGPVAVLMTASQYIQELLVKLPLPSQGYGIILMCICFMVLLLEISSIGKVSFIFSTIAAILLLSGGISSIPDFRKGALFETPFSFRDFGYSILLLFWALVGWEIIGNYSMEVKDRNKTIPKAIFLSVTVITVVCLVVSGATQWIDPHKIMQQSNLKLTMILTPLFGGAAPFVITFITTVLCMSTYLLVTGAVARLIASESKQVKMISLLSYRSKTNVPIGALSLLSAFHLLVFLLLYLRFINVEQIVALANAFFIGNALCGIIAGLKLLPGFFNKGLAVFLIISFLLILSFSSLWVLICIAVLVVFYGILHIKYNDRINRTQKKMNIEIK